MLPFSVIITNKSKKNIWGFTFLYVFRDTLSASGKPWTRRATTASWGPVGSTIMLSPGDSYLLTPVSDLSARKYANGQVLSPPDADEGLVRYVQHFCKDILGRNVSIQIDSVIFDDGTMLGADEAGTQGRVNQRIRAEQDLVAAVDKLEGRDLRDYLAKTKSTSVEDEYYSHKANRAREFEELVSLYGEADLKNQIKKRRYGHWFSGNDFVERKVD